MICREYILSTGKGKDRGNRMKGKTKRGITLVALVITIIILIILAGVTIIELKNNGLLKNLKLAQKIYTNSEDKENILLNSYSDSIEDFSGESPKLEIQFEKSICPFAVKIKIKIDDKDKSRIDFNKCKYTYTNSNKPIGNNIEKYKNNITKTLTESEETAPSGDLYLHVLITNKNGDPTEYISQNSLTNEKDISFDYTGKEEKISLLPGKYRLEVWGAQGGNAYSYNRDTCYLGGYGGYSDGTIELSEPKDFYINVGQQGSTTEGGYSTSTMAYNGGGIARGSDGEADIAESYGAGGGATDISLVSGLLKQLTDLNNILIVAGAGRRSNIL